MQEDCDSFPRRHGNHSTKQNAEETKGTTRRCAVARQGQSAAGNAARGRFCSPARPRGAVDPAGWGWAAGIPLGSGVSHGLARDALSTPPAGSPHHSISGHLHWDCQLQVVSGGAPAFEKFLFLQKEVHLSPPPSLLTLSFPFRGVQSDSWQEE